MEAKDLKIALENYDHFVASVERVKLELEDLETKRFKAGGSIAKIPENPRRREEVIIENLECLTALEKELEYYQRNVDLVNQFVESLVGEKKDIIVAKFIECNSYQQLYAKFGYSRTQLYRIVEKITKELQKL